MDCVICLQPLFGSSMRIKLTNCGHLFHEICIDTAVKTGTVDCPLCKRRLLMRIFREVFGAQGKEAASSSNVADEIYESPKDAESTVAHEKSPKDNHSNVVDEIDDSRKEAESNKTDESVEFPYGAQLKEAGKTVESAHDAKSNEADDTFGSERDTELLLDEGSEVPAAAQRAKSGMLVVGEPSSVAQCVERGTILVCTQSSAAQCNNSGSLVDKQPATTQFEGSHGGKPNTPFCASMVNCKPSTSNSAENVSSAEKPKTNSSAMESGGMGKMPIRMKTPYVRLKLLKIDHKKSDSATDNNARQYAEPIRVVSLGQRLDRPKRKVKSVVRMNYDIIQCCACKKKFPVFESVFKSGDGNVLCSIKCFKNA